MRLRFLAASDEKMFMNCVKRILSKISLGFCAFAGWLATASVALAAPVKEEPKPEVGSGVYVMLYFLIVFCIALGLVSVCRPTNRRDHVKTEQFADRLEAEE
jgi:hypothetical protein